MITLEYIIPGLALTGLDPTGTRITHTMPS